MLDGLKINRYGLLGFVLITIMVLSHMFLVPVPSDNSEPNFLYRLIATFTSPYILLSLIPYIATSFYINNRLSSSQYTKRHLSVQEKWRYQNIYVGLQIALVLLIIGMFLGLNQFLWYVIYYVIAVAVGLFVPFQLFSKPETAKADKSNELEF